MAGATAIIKAIANFLSDDENLNSLLATGESILGAVVNALVQDEDLAKLVEAALSILERLGKYLFDNCEDIFEVQIPKIINILHQFKKQLLNTHILTLLLENMN